MSIKQQLGTLEGLGLLRLAQVEPDVEYLFRHALVQEAAYSSLVKADRRALHGAVGAVVEGAHAPVTDELAPLLARHFDEAGDHARALKYLVQAGDAAARVYALAEATMHYGRALEIEPRAPLSVEKTIHLYTSLGRALELGGRHAEALRVYEALEALAPERPGAGAQRAGPRLRLESLMSRAKIHATLTPLQDPARAQELLERALALARDQRDQGAESKILWNLMLLHLWSGGEHRRAVQLGQEALALARALSLREQQAFTLNDLGYAYMATNQYAQARAALVEACGLWRALGNLPMLADNLANTSLIHFREGRFDEAAACAEEALHLSRLTANLWGQANSQYFVGNVFVERGEFDRAIEVMQAAIHLGDQGGHPAPMIATRADLAWALGLLGATERGLELARTALSKAGEPPHFRVLPLTVLTRLHLLRGEIDAAEAVCQEAVAVLRPEGLRWFAPFLLPLAEGELALARQDYALANARLTSLLVTLEATDSRAFMADALYVRGLALSALGRAEAAIEDQRQAQATAEALGSRRSLWPILLELSQLEAARGREAEARVLRGQAAEIVGWIADHVGIAELRATFLNQPRVRAALTTDAA